MNTLYPRKKSKVLSAKNVPIYLILKVGYKYLYPFKKYCDYLLQFELKSLDIVLIMKYKEECGK